MDKFTQKISETELKDFIANTETNNLEATGDFLIEILMECFLLKTNQSLTHLKIILERYKNFLNSLLGASENSQIVALNSIQEFWAYSQWHIQIYVQTFLEYKLVKPNVVIGWAFKNLENSTLMIIEDCYNWRILENLLDRNIMKIESSKEEIKKVRFHFNLIFNSVCIF